MRASVVSLLLEGRRVAEYVIDPDLDAKHGPRPYLHPVRTLGGVPVTDALPEDHVWHLGASLAVQDVAGTNLWGGRTYVRDAGYTWRGDHGRVVHSEWITREDDRLAHQLRWCDRDGGVLLDERRTLAARIVLPVADPAATSAPPATSSPGAACGTAAGPAPGAASGYWGAWALEVAYTLTAPTHRDIVLGSPATNGRPDGAGYGGFFWRAAPDTRPPAVFTERCTGEQEVNGSAEPWVALARPAYTLVFYGLGAGDRWFVRARMYPGVCAAFAFEKPRMIAAGTNLTGHHTVLVADGELDRPGVRALLTRAGLPA